MEACPKCNRKDHIYNNCPSQNKSEDYKYLIFNRQRKTPVKSQIVLGKVIARELHRQGTDLRETTKMDVPYSPFFAT